MYRRRTAIGFLAALIVLSHPAYSYEGNASTAQDVIGFETDVFPILHEGYHIGVWYGFTHIRLRAFVAKNRVPQFAVKDGFRSNVVQSYALMIVFFPTAGNGEYTNTLLSITGGHLLPIWDNLYISPALGAHVRAASATEVDVQGNLFTPTTVVPDIFIRFG